MLLCSVIVSHSGTLMYTILSHSGTLMTFVLYVFVTSFEEDVVPSKRPRQEAEKKTVHHARTKRRKWHESEETILIEHFGLCPTLNVPSLQMCQLLLDSVDRVYTLSHFGTPMW